eukprot:Tamp_01335.p1 GENE.Tamp_01335~~Tamp_01335.p1  ORF type:complete len:712 (+),score=206.96 Tamp_01335:78-2213(+)
MSEQDPAQRPRSYGGGDVLAQAELTALDCLPTCVALVDYDGPAPKNLWANKAYLTTVGCTLAEFVAQVPTPSEGDVSVWEHMYHEVQVRGKEMCERNLLHHDHNNKSTSVETLYKQCRVVLEGKESGCIMVNHWALNTKDQMVSDTTYLTALLEASPYPLCLFTFDGHLITCNRAARQVFGKTIWLQSDIFGLGHRERLGLNLDELSTMGGSFRIERSERRSAYESMMDALAEPNSSYVTDLPIKKKNHSGAEVTWYCRVLAQRHDDPVTGQPIMMVSHQDVTALRKVEGELGRIQMKEATNKGLMTHDSDVAGSLLTLLGEEWDFMRDDATGKEAQDLSDDEVETRTHVDRPSRDQHQQSLGCQKLNSLRVVLDKADEWRFDVFELERETDGLPLQVLAWHVLMKHRLIEEFNIDHVKLINFLRQIETGHLDNPYHNATHVADVVQSMHCIITKGGLDKLLARIEILAALLAATIHDFEHRGFNNDFLIKTQDDWAIDANDKSPNESHHLSAAFRILRNPECNFLHRMPQQQQQQLRKLMIELVLATDMAEHMAIVSRLKTDVLKRLETPDDNFEVGEEVGEPLKSLILQAAIKVADIGHLYAPQDVHIRWSERLEEEMWLQGDVEKRRNMKVSFLMDRDKPGVTKSQPGFVDFVVRPLFETWVACFPDCKVVAENLEANYQYWKSKTPESPEDCKSESKSGGPSAPAAR